MKELLMMLFLMGSAQAKDKQYHVVYTYGNHKLDYIIEAKDKNEAISLGADICFMVFSQRLSLTTDQKYDLIDTCANPKIMDKSSGLN